jgi:hypothetical protein
MGFDSWKLWGKRGDFLFRDWVRKGQLQMRLLGPGLGGSCTPPHKWLKHVANDALSTRFDDGFGWASVSGICGRGGGGLLRDWVRKGLGSTTQHHVPQESNWGRRGGTSCFGTGCEKTSFKCSYWAQGLKDCAPHPTND